MSQKPVNNFLGVLKKYREWLWPTIRKALSEVNNFPPYCRVASKYQKELNFHEEIVSDYPKRQGKYLRPTLLILTALGMGLAKEKTRKVAAAMQMSEDWILNHDDMEDDSPDRRGQRALHKIYGVPLALNAGDGLQVLMWKMLFDSPKKIWEEFAVMLSRTILGQTIELKWARENKFNLKKEDVLLILESKTGYYTIAGPMRLGAIMAGAQEKELEIIYKFGVNLGVAFQITDDILDLTSDFAGQKKVKGGDILENKKTVMLVYLLEKANKKDRKIIEKILKKKREEKSGSDVKTILELMDKYDSIEYSRKLARKYAQEAEVIFEKEMKFIKKEPYRSQIKSGIEFIVNRDH